jgi:hypothetical protein
VEHRHSSVANSLAKLYKTAMDEIWIIGFNFYLWHFGSDIISARRTAGYSAFEMVYGHEYFLTIQLTIGSWNIIDWKTVKSHKNLILALARM